MLIDIYTKPELGSMDDIGRHTTVRPFFAFSSTALHVLVTSRERKTKRKRRSDRVAPCRSVLQCLAVQEHNLYPYIPYPSSTWAIHRNEQPKPARMEVSCRKATSEFPCHNNRPNNLHTEIAIIAITHSFASHHIARRWGQAESRKQNTFPSH